MGWEPAFVLAVFFFAAFVQSAFGFGSAIIAVPALAFVIPVSTAAPVVVLVGATIAAIVVVQDKDRIVICSASRLFVWALCGIPFGLWLLHEADGIVVKAVLALLIIVFAMYSLLRRSLFRLGDDRWAWLFGFVAGVIGGAYAMSGLPLIIYGTLRGWSPQHFRATMHGYFLPTSLMTAVGYAFAGLWTTTVTDYFLLSLPAVLVATLLGRALNERLNGQSFLSYVHVGLVAIGVLLLVQAVR